MKRSTGIFVLLLMLSLNLSAQSISTVTKNHYVVSTTQIPQLQPIILTALALQEEDDENFRDFQIVFYGPNVLELTDNEKMETYTRQAKAAGVNILVCRISIDRLGIDPKDMHGYIKMVDHAYTHIIQLQKNQNYYSLQL